MVHIKPCVQEFLPFVYEHSPLEQRLISKMNSLDKNFYETWSHCLVPYGIMSSSSSRMAYITSCLQELLPFVYENSLCKFSNRGEICVPWHISNFWSESSSTSTLFVCSKGCGKCAHLRRLSLEPSLLDKYQNFIWWLISFLWDVRVFWKSVKTGVGVVIWSLKVI